MPSAPRILVVDDDSAIRDLLADALDGEGYDVVTAINGADAVVKLAGFRPDAIVLDLMMPVMDGKAFLAACRQKLRMAATPVVVLSASYDLAAVAPELGARACMAKPFDLDVLLAVVEQLVRSGEDGTANSGSAPLGSDGSQPETRRRIRVP